MTSLTAAHTVWTYNVPNELRPMLSAAFPEIEFRFISIHTPTEKDRARISRSTAPALAVWAGRHPPDMWDVAHADQVPVLRISPSLLSCYATSGIELVPLGFSISRAAPMQERTVRAFPAVGDLPWPSLSPEALAAGAQLREAFVNERLTTYTHRPSRLALPAPRQGAPRVFVIDEEQNELHVPIHAAESGVADLIRQARADHPGSSITLLLNADPVQTGRRMAVLGDAVGAVDQVIGGHYHAALLEADDHIYTLSSMAGLDALARGIRTTCLGAPLYARAMPGAGAALSLDEVFAYYFIDGHRYLDPSGVNCVPPEVALDMAIHEIKARRIAAPHAGPVAAIEEAPPAAPALPEAAGLRERIQARDSRMERRLRRIFGGLGDDDAYTLSIATTPLQASLLGHLSDRSPGLRFAAVEDSEAVQAALAYATQHIDLAIKCLIAALAELRRRPLAVLVLDHGLPLSRALLKAADALGIPSFYLPLELRPAVADEDGWIEAINTYDRIFSWRRRQDRSPQLLTFEERQVLPVGLPALADAAARRATDRDRAMGLDPTRPTLGLWLASDNEHVARERASLLNRASDLLPAELSARGWQLVVCASTLVIGALRDSFFGALLRSPDCFVDLDRMIFADPLALAAHVDGIVFAEPMLVDLAEALGCRSALLGPAGGGTGGGHPQREVELSDAEDLFSLLHAPRPEVHAAPDAAMTLAAEARTARIVRPSPIERFLNKVPVPFHAFGIDSGDNAVTGSQRFLQRMLRTNHRQRAVSDLPGKPDLLALNYLATWGTRPTRAMRNVELLARQLLIPLLRLEDGLVRSVRIGLTGDPGLSVMVDDRGIFYDATRPSRLEDLLNSELKLSEGQLRRARHAIDLMCRHRVSKYNHAPDFPLRIGPAGRRGVLVVDQRHGDQSIELGLATSATFQQMLADAVSENPEANIYVKQHPDALSKLRGSCLGLDVVAPFLDMANFHVIDFDVNPFALFDVVDTVYVVTSGMGFEALMAGLVVKCYGAPFYSNWSITDDKIRIDRRKKARSVEEVFYAAYIMMSNYFDPESDETCEIEQLVNYISAQRIDDLSSMSSWEPT